jgi:hypothetical protein
MRIEIRLHARLDERWRCVRLVLVREQHFEALVCDPACIKIYRQIRLLAVEAVDTGRTYQLSAFDGMKVSTLGVNPLAKPFAPCLLHISCTASLIPRAFRISASVLDPLVCSSVFATSSGVVTAPPTPPAIPPASTCVIGEYSLLGLISFLQTSYVLNWTAVKGTVMTSVVG